MGSGRSAPGGRRKTRAGSRAGAEHAAPSPCSARAAGGWEGVSCLARLRRRGRAGPGGPPGAPGLGVGARGLRSGARVTCEEGRKSRKAGRRAASWEFSARRGRRELGLPGKPGTRQRRGPGSETAGAAPRVGGRERDRGRDRSETETRRGETGQGERKAGDRLGRRRRRRQGPAGRDRETDWGRRDREKQRAEGAAGEVAAEPGLAGRGGLGARGERSGAGSGAQGGGQRGVTAREQWGRRREGACGGGGGRQRHGSPDPRALSPGPGPDDAEAEAAPRARRGAALKVGRPAGSGAGRPGDRETRGPTDRPTGSRGGGAGPAHRVRGEWAPGHPSPRPGRRPPDCAWDVAPVRRLPETRRTLRPAVSRARARRWRCPSSVRPRACLCVPGPGGSVPARSAPYP